jgi:uncharacterized protein (TIGR02588 family)
MPETKTSTARKRGKNALEWAVFGISSVLVAATMAVLLMHTVSWQERPPELAAKLGEPGLKDRIVTVTVEVTNHGDVAASEVEVEIARSAGSSEQRASVLLDFVPRHGTRRGQVSFPDATEAGELRITGIGFAEP